MAREAEGVPIQQRGRRTGVYRAKTEHLSTEGKKNRCLQSQDRAPVNKN